MLKSKSPQWGHSRSNAIVSLFFISITFNHILIQKKSLKNDKKRLRSEGKQKHLRISKNGGGVFEDVWIIKKKR